MSKLRDAYHADLVFAFVVRLGIWGGLVAILATMLAACSVTAPQDLLANRPAVVKSPLGDDQEAETRNRQPQGGCDEKSGYTPTLPLERFSKVVS